MSLAPVPGRWRADTNIPSRVTIVSVRVSERPNGYRRKGGLSVSPYHNSPDVSDFINDSPGRERTFSTGYGEDPRTKNFTQGARLVVASSADPWTVFEPWDSRWVLDDPALDVKSI